VQTKGLCRDDAASNEGETMTQFGVDRTGEPSSRLNRDMPRDDIWDIDAMTGVAQ
jgi:hypothetical protein